MEVLETDVLVVGGGAAGTLTAINAQRGGARVTLVSKGPVGKSGASIFAGNFPMPGSMLTSEESHRTAGLDYSIKYFNSFLVDQGHNQRVSEWAAEHLWRDLERDGLYLRRNDDGSLAQSFTPARNMVALRHGQSGMHLMDLRRKQVFAAGVNVMDEAMVTRLLTDQGGNVNGAVVLNIVTGSLFAVHAQAVVLATGHADRLAQRSTATREQSADGLALAWGVGAELENLEIGWWHIGDVARPASWQRLHIYPNPLVNTSESARMYNSRGELFFDLATHAPNATVPYVAQQKLLIREVQKGNARFDGGYYASYAHIDPEVLRSYNYQVKVWDRLGLDVTKDKLEAAASWHFRAGGIHTRLPDLTTTVPGLFVAGAVGAHYIGGVASVNYDGHAITEPLLAHVADTARTSLDLRAAESEIARVQQRRRPIADGGVAPARLKRELRQVMSTYMGPIKNERGMNRALEDVLRLRHEVLPHLGLRYTGSTYNQSWVDSIDAENLLLVAELTIRASLSRTESRGPFYREDYPVTDNVNWLCRNIISAAGDTIATRQVPFETPTLQPEAERSPYFDIAW